ncbi:MAG: Ribosome hibernation promotion factor [Hyphomicrobiaceae bacterium hypho_1]
MTIQVTGKNIEVGDALKNYLIDRTRCVLDKYIGLEISGHIRVAKKHGKFQTNCSIRLRTGLLLEAQGEASDAYASADNALERLDKRVRRYKRRLKDHHSKFARDSFQSQTHTAPDYVVQPSEEDSEEENPSNEPLIIAEMKRQIQLINVSEAVMQLDLTEETFLVFRNVTNNAINIVYRRDDNNIGWIDPVEN